MHDDTIAYLEARLTRAEAALGAIYDAAGDDDPTQEQEDKAEALYREIRSCEMSIANMESAMWDSRAAQGLGYEQ